MADPKYTDILVTDNDLTLDAGGQPVLIYDRDVIAQDLVHMIRETGLLVELVANRDERHKASNLIKLELAVEDDPRIVPGTVQIEEPSLGTFYLTATTAEFGDVNLQLEA